VLPDCSTTTPEVVASPDRLLMCHNPVPEKVAS
jgi:hypothetical protein